MMTPNSIELIGKCVKSFYEYFNKIPDDRLLAMTVNPLLCTHGFPYIIDLLDEEGVALQNRAKWLLEKNVRNVLQAKGRSTQSEADNKDGKQLLSPDNMIDSVYIRSYSYLFSFYFVTYSQ